jgi:two-component system, NarL family, response regulator
LQPETPASAEPIRILIAEDHLIARAGLQAIIAAQPDMVVVAEASNGEQAIDLYRLHLPDVVLLDMRMPIMDGFAALTALRAEFPNVRVAALSTFCGDEDIRRAMNAGAQAYLTKDVLPNELIGAIRAVHAGERYLPELVLAILAAEVPRLSTRELEVLRLVAQGFSNKRIAFELNIAEDTAKNHVKSILKKLEADDRTQAATEAIQRGIIHL